MQDVTNIFCWWEYLWQHRRANPRPPQTALFLWLSSNTSTFSQWECQDSNPRLLGLYSTPILTCPLEPKPLIWAYKSWMLCRRRLRCGGLRLRWRRWVWRLRRWRKSLKSPDDQETGNETDWWPGGQAPKWSGTGRTSETSGSNPEGKQSEPEIHEAPHRWWFLRRARWASKLFCCESNNDWSYLFLNYFVVAKPY